MYKFGLNIIKHRIVILLAILACFVYGSTFLKNLYFDNSVDSFFLEGDQHAAKYQRFLDTFGSDEYFVVMLEVGDEWETDELLLVDKLAKELAEIKDVEQVDSIISVSYVSGENDEIVVEDFIPQEKLYSSDFDPGHFRDKALANEYYTGLYVSDDGKYVAVVAETPVNSGEIQYKMDITQAAREVIYSDQYKSLSPYVAGAPILDADVRNIISAESSLFMGTALLVVIIGYWVVFRSLLAVVLPVMISLLATFAAFCISGAMGAPFGILTSIIPAFLISVGSTASVYLQTELFLEAELRPEQGVDNPIHEMIARAFSKAALPSILSGITTAAALLAFSSSGVRPVMEVGVIMGLGLLVAISLTVLLIPIAYSFKKQWRENKKQRERLKIRTEVMSKLARFVFGHRAALAIVAFFITAFSVFGLTQLKVDYFYLGLFKSDVPIKQNFDKIDGVLGNSSTIELVFSTEEGVSNSDYVVQNYIEELAEHVEQFEATKLFTRSSVDIIKDVHRAVNDGDEKYYTVPESSAKIANLLFLFELGGGDELENVFSMDEEQIRLTIFLPSQAHSKNVLVENYINDYIAANPYSDNGIDQIEVTGLIPLWTVITNYLLDSQIQSVLFAVLVVLIAMCIIFRSFVMAGAMCMGNALAIIWVMGFMGYMGINLDPYTILISAIAIGILDDDTIHFVKRFQNELKGRGNRLEALNATFESTGQAIFWFSGVLILAFMSYVFSDVQSLANFGLLIAMTIFLGMLVEFFVNPTILLYLTSDDADDHVEQQVGEVGRVAQTV